MGNIVLLDELTINKIAAGEVIERPSSVIKEMIENSIDAKATNITIDIQNGGISYIKITDNGKGIQKDDLEMAFERHATSKIRCAEDLNQVKSMGFRGEALASIAAISNVELVSKTEDQQIGYKVVVEGGQVLQKEEIGCQTGTTITVRNLFFNTPVRYKFLKKDYTETGYIEDVVTRIALINPDIAFKLINTGKTILQTSGNGDLRSVIYSIFGKDTSQGIIEVNYSYEDMKITGVIGKPEIARSNRSNQLFFVNKRYIKDKILTAATEQAYKGIIDAGKFAFIVLNIDMPQTKVDVNVHPAKLEVRFEEESKVFQAIFHAIKDALSKEINNQDKSVIEKPELQNRIQIGKLELEDKPKALINKPELEDKPKSLMDKPELEDKPKSLGFFNWKKSKENTSLNDSSNIIADLYNKKKENEFPDLKTDNEVLNTVKKDNKGMEDNIVNTSDVLKELKQINENVKKDLEDEISKKELKQEEKKEIKVDLVDLREKNLPDGTTYTYIGENKDKIEDLLRQLHPETYKTKTVEAVAEVEENYELNKETNITKLEEVEEVEKLEEAEEVEKLEEVKEVEEVPDIEKTQEIKIEKPENTEQATQKFEIIKENMRKLDENIKEEEKKLQEQDEQAIVEEQTVEENIQDTSSNDFNQMYEKLFGTPVIKEKTKEEKEQDEKLNAVDIIKDNISVFEGIEKYQKPAYKFIGIVFESYIIAEIEKEMYIINQRTAKEKIMYENLKNNYYNQVNKDSQLLLLPDIVELSNKQIEIIKENYDILAKAGFSFEEFGENTIKLIGVPTVCLDLDTKKLFVEILDEINTVARTSKQEKEEKFIATIASKISQKGNLAISIQEINNLLDELLSLPNPFVYDFDKPIAIKMTKYDIERKFSRK